MLHRRKGHSPSEVGKRLQLDYDVCQEMFCPLFTGEAYRTTEDLQDRRNPITSSVNGHIAKAYRVDFHVKTLIAPDRFADSTTIGFNLDIRDYPDEEPATWIISSDVPYSPHFKYNSPICIGEIWQAGQGKMLLGQLFVHIAKLLNWDEEVRGGGYEGWNPEALAYYRRKYNDRPLTPGLRYPLLPAWLSTEDTNALQEETQTPLFRSLEQPTVPLSLNNDLFKGKGSW